MIVMRLLHTLLFPALWGLCAGLCIGAAPQTAPQTLDELKSEKNLEKRSRLALDYAQVALDRAMKTYLEGDEKNGLTMLGELRQAVELSKESLDATGKVPSKSPKHFKYAEIETRKLMRELEDAERQVDFEDRDEVRAVHDRVEAINHELLLSIMTKPQK